MCLCPRSGAQTGGGGWERQHRGHRLSVGHPPGTCSQPRRYQCSAFLKHISSRTTLLPSSLARATGTTATAEVKETVHDRCLAHDVCEDGMCQLILSVSTTEPDVIGFDSRGQCVCICVHAHISLHMILINEALAVHQSPSHCRASCLLMDSVLQ